MAFKFLLPFKRFNLSFLFEGKKKEIIQKLELEVIKIIEIFE